jgi:hypothetical protein
MFDGAIFGQQIVDAVRGYISRELGPILQRLAAVEARPREESAAISELQKRLARVEDRPQLRYRNVFQEGQSYAPGDVVTWGGSMWHCNAPTTDKPGDGQSVWTLAVKRGRDGK